MQIGSINNKQSFGMRIPYTDALGETIRFWRMNGAKQTDINRNLSKIKKMLPDTFELKADKFNSTQNTGATKFYLIFKDGTSFEGCSDAKSYDFLKNLKAAARMAKRTMIEKKGQKAVTGREYGRI